VIEFGISPAVQERVGVLAERANEGVLTEDERLDYEALINAADFIAILKLKAQRRLTSNFPSVTDAEMRDLVRNRAKDRCEYCLIHWA
jgi:hypothetical protein